MNYKRSSARLFSTLRRGMDFVLPPRCPLNGGVVGQVGDLSVEAWRDLTFISDPKCSCCGFPFEIVDTAEGETPEKYLCGTCLDVPKPYGRARSALAYDDVSRDLVLAFKHGDRTHLKVTLAAMLLKAGEDILDEADLIVPVPLHWLRLLRRRYNQAALLAREVSRLSGVPFRSDLLLRTRHTPPQGHKSNKDRHANVKGVFAIPAGKTASIEGKRIVLIDDVYTTGATIEECVRTLMSGGAANVDVLTVARVLKSG